MSIKRMIGAALVVMLVVVPFVILWLAAMMKWAMMLYLWANPQ